MSKTEGTKPMTPHDRGEAEKSSGRRTPYLCERTGQGPLSITPALETVQKATSGGTSERLTGKSAYGLSGALRYR